MQLDFTGLMVQGVDQHKVAAADGQLLTGLSNLVMFLQIFKTLTGDPGSIYAG